MISFSTASLPIGMGFLWLPHLSLSYPSLCSPSLVCIVETVQSALNFSSGGVALYVVIYSLGVPGGGEFRVFLPLYLGPASKM